MSAFRVLRRLRDLLDVDTTGAAVGDALVLDADGETWVPGAGGGGGGAPTDADYLVGTANGSLSGEIVVGTSPGGELGGTWASPTVDATHSGSSHASVQAAAEATAASALATHSADTTAVHGITDTSALLTTTAGDAAYQPKDADLTAIAALTTTSFGRGLLEVANQAGLLSATGAAAASHVHAGEDITSGTVADARIASTIARDSEVTSAISALSSVYQAKDTTLDTYAGIDPSANVQSVLSAADYAAIRTLLGLVIGTNVQAYDADLTTYAGITPSANVQSFLGAANYAAMKTQLALTIGTNVEAWDADLDAIAALSPSNDDIIQRKAGAWTNRTIAQLLTDLGLSSDGWTAAGETWTYASADAPTFTFTIAGVDLTSKYSVGMRVKLTQTTAKYFIITKVAFSTDTTITVYGGTDYTLANAAITSPYWSMLKAPFGFPLDPLKWTITLISDTSDRAQASPTSTTWYNLGSLSGALHIGVWEVSYAVILDCDAGAAANTYTTLSTANNSESNAEMTSFYAIDDTASDRVIHTQSRARVLTMSSKTTHYLNAKVVSGSAIASVDFRGDLVKTLVLAECAYL